MSYRHNADEMSVSEEMRELSDKVAKLSSKNQMNSEQQYNVKMTRSIVGGILGFLLLSGGMGYGCNHEDNATKREVAKMCPAVSPILAVGLTKQDK